MVTTYAESWRTTVGHSLLNRSHARWMQQVFAGLRGDTPFSHYAVSPQLDRRSKGVLGYPFGEFVRERI